MAVQVWMPTFGMTEGEAQIVRWLKAVGDPVKADEPLLEAETDKATLEVPAPADGVLLHIETEAGRSAPYKSLLGWIGQAGEQITWPAHSGPVSDPTVLATPTRQADDRLPAIGVQPQVTEAPAVDDWVRASPLARRIAQEHGLDLRRVAGTGPAGRVQEVDVRRALAASALPTPQPLPARSGGSALPGEPAGIAQSLTSARRITAERMAASFRSAPHFYLQVEIRAGRLVALREELLPQIEEQAGVRLSHTDLLLRSLAATLPRHPLLNATWQDGEVRTLAEVNLGVAVAAPQGLLVPVIRNAPSLSLVELVQAREALVQRAKAGKLGPAEFAGGTFTLTNLGMYGVDSFIPILNPPQSAILAAGAIAERPIGLNGQVVLQPTLNLTLAVDHRVADGMQAAEFLRELRELLEAPSRMLLT